MSRSPESRWPKTWPAALACAGWLLAFCMQAQAQGPASSLPAAASASVPGAAPYAGLGRSATPAELAAWDIDVRPDFKGLPAGSGSVAQGQQVWESKCASCHGVFGESNQVFTPITGGISAQDLQTGHVARLRDPSFPSRTILMKLATLSTLWDYIHRAMPWTNPKSLSTDEVYAVTAFLLSLAEIVPDDFVLSDQNIADVQKRMPNRNGMQTRHAMWPGKEFNGMPRPDTQNVACMRDCTTEPKLSSFLPDFARNNHGNLREQNRLIGPQRGADTTSPEGKAASLTQTLAQTTPAATARPAGAEPADNPANKAALALIQKHSCSACHAVDKKLVGPAFADIAKKHAGRADYLAAKIKSGGQGVWGPIPMPPQSLPETDAKAIANWLASGAGK